MIRQFLNEDAHACWDLIRECVERSPGITPDLRGKLLESESPATMIRRSGSFYIAVAEDHGEITGLAALDMNEIRLLFVSPASQGKGIGSALLRHIEDMVPAAMFPDIIVYAAPEAARFYRARGYQARGEHIFHLGRTPFPTIFMSKSTRTGVP